MLKNKIFKKIILDILNKTQYSHVNEKHFGRDPQNQPPLSVYIL